VGHKCDVFEGQVFNGQPHGHGRFIYAYGNEEYVGPFFNGLRDTTHTDARATGQMRFGNGDVYIGEWREGKKEGTGTMKWAFGDKYEGEWLADKMHGQGSIFYHVDKSTYQGKFELGKRMGPVVHAKLPKGAKQKPKHGAKVIKPHAPTEDEVRNALYDEKGIPYFNGNWAKADQLPEPEPEIIYTVYNPPPVPPSAEIVIPRVVI
jgi:hypothetical protein